jgi:hypothetical protein
MTLQGILFTGTIVAILGVLGYGLYQLLTYIINNMNNMPANYGYVDKEALVKVGVVDDKAAFLDYYRSNGFMPREKHYRIGNSGLFFFIDQSLVRFSISVPYLVETIRIYEVASIRRFFIDDDEASWVAGSSYQAPASSGGSGGGGFGFVSGGTNATSVMLRIVLDSLDEPQLELQFLEYKVSKSSAIHQAAVTSAQELISVLEYLISKRIGDD